MSKEKNINELSSKEKLALLKQKLSEKANKENVVYPLSYGQKALYFLYLSTPESAAYNVAFTCRIVSNPDINALKKSFQRLLNRDESLRTTYYIRDGIPVQEVHGFSEINFEHTDCTGFSEAELKNKITDIYKIPFDLENGPVFRVYLFEAGKNNFILMMKMHHICSDGWSIGIMLNELKQLYEDEINGTHSSFQPLTHTYHDYVSYNQELAESSEGEKIWTYWRNELSGELPVLNMPTDYPRPSVQTMAGLTEHFLLDNKLTDRLKKLAQSEGTTLFVVLMTAYQILLHRYSEQHDIIVGTPTAGRSKTEFSNIIGYFINPVVIRGIFSGDMTFSEFLKQIKGKVLGAITNQEYPFQLIVEKLLKSRDPSRSPVFQAFFGLQKVPKGKDIQELIVPGNEGVRINWSSLVLESYEIPQQEGQFDLMLELFEGENIFPGLIKYNSNIFSKERIRRMCIHFRTLLESIADNPGKNISRLEIMSDEEKKIILEDWNSTYTDYNNSLLLEEMISRQSDLTPENIAVEFEDRKLTYRELEKITNQLGNLLVKSGVTNDSLVGIFIERSFEMITGLLGILKAGGAYVPIDPSYPQERIDYMIKDSGVKIILSTDSVSKMITGKTDKIILLDRDKDLISKESSDFPIRTSGPDSLAYMIYTSGSTGKPKGAMNTQKAIINRLLWMKDYLRINPEDKIFQKTSFSFDVSVWEFFLPLISGATLVFAKPDGQKDTQYLIEEIQNKSITVMHFVPSMLQVFLEDINTGNCSSLKKVICSGEELTVAHQNLFFSKFENTELYNLYGPTEAAVDVTYWKCNPQSSLNVVPIGKPVANTQIYILDQNLNPVPAGIPGELHIGGIQVARGYHNKLELTSEKFIPDPFIKNAGSKLYKTGDLVRFQYDGNIEYLGRIDNQIKIRGFRIELGEIEFILNSLEEVRESIVIAREVRQGDKRLAAFVVLQKDKKITSNEIRNILKEKLPEYMVPSQIIFLDEIPLSQNGKADRKALLTYDFTRDELQSEFLNATNPIEEILVNIWKEILSLDKVGINDNFFELGGDSILSIQIISKASQKNIKITPKQIFQYQTIAELASAAEITGSNLIKAEDATGNVILTPAQSWFFDSKDNGFSHFNHSVLLKVPSDIDESILEKASEEIFRHHDSLRARFVKNNTEWEQTIEEYRNEKIFDTEDLTGNDSSGQNEKMKISINNLHKSFDLKKGPLIRIRLYRTGTNEDRILIIIHHLCVDGISWRIILEDFYNAYNQLRSKRKTELPLKTTSLKEWSLNLKKYADSEKLKEELGYWLETVSAKTIPVNRDFSSDASSNRAGTAETVNLKIDSDRTESILQEIPKVYNTKINDILLTALILAYYKWTNGNKLLIDLEGHGREDLFENVNTSSTTGWFTAIFPVLLNTGNPDDIGDTLKSVKEDLRRIPENGIGFGILKYLCDDESVRNKIKSLPKPEIIFNYLGQFSERITPESDWKLGSKYLIIDQESSALRKHLIEINSYISEGSLKMEFVYSNKIHNKVTIEQLAKYYEDTLSSVIQHCKSPDAGGYTPSDFSEAGLDQQELDNLFANLN